jgi:sugar/nucleoside kinase (ribokinase family)
MEVIMEILTIGGLLAEIMRKDLDEPFTQAADLTGPYPSGDATIFADVAARLGNKVAMVGTVGNDGFGECIVNRLKEDGVDVSSIKVDPLNTTGVAFVAYFSDGSRNFIYHWRYAAAGQITYDQVNPELLKDLKCLHLTGVGMSVNDSMKETMYKLNNEVSDDTLVNFDPNIRPEVLSADEIRELCRPVLERCDIFFPSATEAQLFTQMETDELGCKKLAAEGKLVVLKNGEKGCVIYSGDQRMEVPSFEVEEIDPTGAGDSFAAGFITAYLRGYDLKSCGYYANAVGALSVTKKGPMEGAPYEEEVLEFLKKNNVSLELA